MGTVPPPPRKGAYTKHVQGIHKQQWTAIQSKNAQEVVLLDNIKAFFKQKAALDKQYQEGLTKICAVQHRNYESLTNCGQAQLQTENLAKIWLSVIATTEEDLKEGLEQRKIISKAILTSCKKLKEERSKKAKKVFERITDLQRGVLESVAELDNTKRTYFAEESDAIDTKTKAVVAEDRSRGRKKDMLSLFQSKTTLKKAAKNLAIKQEETDIRSVGARNDYILSVSATNAHQECYYKNDLPETIRMLESDLYETVRTCLHTFFKNEFDFAEKLRNRLEAMQTQITACTRESNYNYFVSAFPFMNELITYSFENCPGDEIQVITASEHDAGYSLNYEARQNSSKYNQAVKTINAFEKRIEACMIHKEKGLTREPNDTGGPDLNTKIMELQIAIATAKTDKAKARAKLDRLKEGGVAVEELLEVVAPRPQSYQRQQSQQQQQQQMARQESRGADQAMAGAVDSWSIDDEPAAAATTNEDTMGADAFQDQGAAAPVQEDNWATWDDSGGATTTAADENGWGASAAATTSDETAQPQAEAAAVSDMEVHPQPAEGTYQLAKVVYNFEAQNSDELSINENDTVKIVDEECDEEGWVVAYDAEGHKGYVPLNYLEIEEAGAVVPEATAAPTQDSGYSSGYSSSFGASSSVPEPFGQPAAPPALDTVAEENWASDNWATPFSHPAPTAAPAFPPPASGGAAPPLPSQPPPFELSSDEDSSEEEEEESEFCPPPMGAAPAKPPSPPRQQSTDFEAMHSKSSSVDHSLSTMTRESCFAVYDYEATGADEISFKSGDKIRVLDRTPNGIDDGWWKGQILTGDNVGKTGLFPSIICEVNDSSDESESYSLTTASVPPPMGAPPTKPVSKTNSMISDDMEIVVTKPSSSEHSFEDIEPPPPPPVVEEKEPPKEEEEEIIKKEATPIVVEDRPAPPAAAVSRPEVAPPPPPPVPAAPAPAVVPKTVVEPNSSEDESESSAPAPPSPPVMIRKQSASPPVEDSSDAEEPEPPPPPVVTTYTAPSSPDPDSSESEGPPPPPPPTATSSSAALEQQAAAAAASSASPRKIIRVSSSSSSEGEMAAAKDSRSSSTSSGPEMAPVEPDPPEEVPPPEDINIKELKKLDTIKESSA